MPYVAANFALYDNYGGCLGSLRELSLLFCFNDLYFFLLLGHVTLLEC